MADDDDPAYLASLVSLCDQFVSDMRAALGNPANERAAVERALEGYRANRRAHSIWPDDEFQTHFFLADPLQDPTGKQLRRAGIDELGLDDSERARISDLFLDVLGI